MSRKASYITLICTLAIAGAFALASVTPGHAQNSDLAVFDGIAKGQWTIRFRDDSPSRTICVRSGEELLQLKHAEADCSRVIIANEKDEATVQYSCRAKGYGRTTIRRETRALIQLSSQGIAEQRPFQIYGEARHQGECP